MQGPIKLSLERLAKTYGIEDLGPVWITTNLDGSRSLVLQQATPRAPLVPVEFAERWLAEEVTG